MSILDKVSRSIRRVNDAVTVNENIAASKCVLYRFEQVDDPDTSTVEGKIARRFQQSGETEQGRTFSTPIETEVFVDWQSTWAMVNKHDKANADVVLGEDVPIEARFNFEDHVTRGSYVKIPISVPNQEDTYDPGSEKNTIQRLEVSGIDGKGQSVVFDATWKLTIKRSETDRAPSDDAIMADVPNDFFDV